MIIGNLINENKYITCLNPYKGSYILFYDVKKIEEKGMYTYLDKKYDYLPELPEIKNMIIEYYNKKCDEEILKGLKFENAQVWLTAENQFNYKSAFDFTIQTQGSNLPVKFKFGDNDEVVYKTFNTVEELQIFITIVMNHVNNTLSKYWEIKDNIDWDKYIIE